MISALLAMMTWMQSASAPIGVNGSVLGKAEEFAFHGPGKVCLREAWVDLTERETAHLKYSGIHHQTIEISGPNGTLELEEGEAWAKPNVRRTLLFHKPGMDVFEIGTDTEFRYLVYGATEYSAGHLVPMIWVDGDVLRGDIRDKKIVSRINLGAANQGCRITYNYGWGVLLEGEPIVTRENESTQ